MKMYKDKEDNFYGYHKEGAELTTKEYYDEVMARKQTEHKATDEYKIVESESYLASTDYMVIREVDGGKPISVKVKKKREECRQILHKLKD